jgi:hypothetical protein
MIKQQNDLGTWRSRRAADSTTILARQLDEIRKLGIADFETADMVAARQADVVESLKSNAWVRTLRRRLQECSEEGCGQASFERRMSGMPLSVVRSSNRAPNSLLVSFAVMAL